jgi:hypothetical protein
MRSTTVKFCKDIIKMKLLAFAISLVTLVSSARHNMYYDEVELDLDGSNHVTYDLVGDHGSVGLVEGRVHGGDTLVLQYLVKGAGRVAAELRKTDNMPDAYKYKAHACVSGPRSALKIPIKHVDQELFLSTYVDLDGPYGPDRGWISDGVGSNDTLKGKPLVRGKPIVFTSCCGADDAPADDIFND